MVYYITMSKAIKISVLCCWLVIILHGGLSAQNYRWPMKIKPRLSSHFGDYRAGHWHAGIDLTTRGNIGYKLYAIANGHIYRVRTSFWGYGRALYLKLDDGRYAIYGHLQRFSPEIEEIIRRQQMREKKYYQDIYFKPGQFPVKKGDYIALSGQSGAGAPHLHFEIRNKDNIPVNPLKNIYNMNDTRPPVVDYLVIKRYKKSYGLANYHDLEFLKLDGQSRNISVADTVAVYGKTVFSVSAYDPNGGYNYCLYGGSLVLDSTQIFSFEHNRLDYDTGNQIDYVRDYSLKNLVEKYKGIKNDNDKNVFYGLFIQQDDRQSFYGDYSYPAGIIDAESLKPGIHSLIINLYDINGNRSQIRLYLKKAALEKPPVISVDIDSVSETMHLGSFPASHTPQIQSRKAPCMPYRTISSDFDMFDRKVRFKYPQNAYDYRIRIIDNSSDFSPWIVFDPEVDSEYVVPYADYYEVILPVELVTSSRIEKTGVAEIFPLNNQFMRISKQVLQVHWSQIPLFGYRLDTSHYFLFHSGGQVNSPDSKILINLEDHQLYGPTVIQITEPIQNDTGGYTFKILPQNLLFKDNVEIIAISKQLDIDTDHASLYYYSSNKDKWFFIGTKSSDSLTGETLGGGKFGILVDDIPPEIRRLRPRNNGKIKDSTPLLSCEITDDLSGLKQETQLEMTIDGTWVPAYYDIDDKSFTYQVRSPLKKGRHTLRASAIDNQGNRSTAVSRFTITGKQ